MKRQALRKAAGLATAALLLTACSDGNTIAEQAQSGDNKGYIAGDGAVEFVAAADRETVLEIDGMTLEGEPWSSVDARGDVLVVNVWGSWCGPCIDEAPDLEQVYTEFTEAGEPVDFIGVNARDSVPSALAFKKPRIFPIPRWKTTAGQPCWTWKALPTLDPAPWSLTKRAGRGPRARSDRCRHAARPR
ncbi:TlpA disulfide reductase family protein [Ornithinimicrobium sp. INDO-MA30-4]|uniref:TlpA family protein disulfide reductase n=1 Tax=Ornithinimicrobium sp. INDO-MA30-4 TaxID=2908651 RepID=UPI001F3E95FE|nr:TlpA disulfide reductase family protein [Ornithinimicrobium sp. INDO-MA30-4]UJH70517.1 TlpA family protein disulfide reductase [Ornithinimicrobium sp. INDO-MA30-4]